MWEFSVRREQGCRIPDIGEQTGGCDKAILIKVMRSWLGTLPDDLRHHFLAAGFCLYDGAAASERGGHLPEISGVC